MLLFESHEYIARVRRTKEAMIKRGIDVLIVASPANQFWLTGYDGWSFYTPQVVVVSLQQEEPIWIGRKMDAVGAKFTAFLDDSNVIPYPDQYVASSDLHPLLFVAEEIQRLGWDKGRIGVETDDYYYTARWDAILREKSLELRVRGCFPARQLVQNGEVQSELDYMRQAGQIAAAAHQAAFDAARPGVRQCDVMAEVYRVTTSGLPEFGGTFPCKPPNAMVGEYCSAPHLSWTDAPLAENDLFYIELGGVRHRYHSPLSRCIYLGKPTERMNFVASVIAEGLHAVLDKVRPGVVCEELAAVWKSVISGAESRRIAGLDIQSALATPPPGVNSQPASAQEIVPSSART